MHVQLDLCSLQSLQTWSKLARKAQRPKMPTSQKAGESQAISTMVQEFCNDALFVGAAPLCLCDEQAAKVNQSISSCLQKRMRKVVGASPPGCLVHDPWDQKSDYERPLDTSLVGVAVQAPACTLGGGLLTVGKPVVRGKSLAWLDTCPPKQPPARRKGTPGIAYCCTCVLRPANAFEQESHLTTHHREKASGKLFQCTVEAACGSCELNLANEFARGLLLVEANSNREHNSCKDSFTAFELNPCGVASNSVGC